MGRWAVLTIALLVGGTGGWAQSGTAAPDSNYRIYTEGPRIFLRPQRLRLLRRERDRQSLRWQQFQLLMAGKAPMPEPGFANALYYQVSGDAAYGRRAVTWALGNSIDLRQLALVFDWCRDLLTDVQAKTLAGKLTRGIDATESARGVPEIRSRTLAALALTDRAPEVAAKVMEQTVRKWWEETVVPGLKEGRPLIRREDAWALFEILHVVRDNLNNDLRDSVPPFFKNYPIDHLLSHYPAIFPAADGEYRIPAAAHMKGEPDLRVAALSRAAELSMVAFDSNAPESQVLQGWLMDDHFLMRGPFGISYEFLWANPYQPGLSYYHVPLIFHDELFGRLFIRSAWDESASWMGVFDGEAQLFQEGKVTVLNPQITAGPFPLTEALVFFGSGTMKFKVKLDEEDAVFVIGLKPRQRYDVELDNQEMFEATADNGGNLALTVPRKAEIGVRIKAAAPAGL